MDRRLLARQLSAIENGEMQVDYVEGDVIAITGPPGVGKSCILDAIFRKSATFVKSSPFHKKCNLANFDDFH